MTKEITEEKQPVETELGKAARLFVEGYSEVLARSPLQMGFTPFDLNYNDGRVSWAMHAKGVARREREAQAMRPQTQPAEPTDPTKPVLKKVE